MPGRTRSDRDFRTTDVFGKVTVKDHFRARKTGADCAGKRLGLSGVNFRKERPSVDIDPLRDLQQECSV